MTDRQLQRLGTAIRNRRIDLGISQAELSENTGIARYIVSGVERGKPGHTAILVEIANHLGLDLFALPREDPRAASARHDAEALNPSRRIGRKAP